MYADTVNYVKKYMTLLSMIYSEVKRYKKLVPKITASDPNTYFNTNTKIPAHTYQSHCVGHNDLDLLANANHP